ncbi:MAG: flagellar protein FlaG [Nitrospirae bacterium]|nr:flagellar protein FlaG [Nitrospirota bacterium]
MEIRSFDTNITATVRENQTVRKPAERQDTTTGTVQRDDNQEIVSLSIRNSIDAQEASNGEKPSVTAKNDDLKKEEESANQAKKKAEEEKKLFDKNFSKAYFAVDENNNVVIRIVDHEGKLIRQVPPEDYLKMLEKMKKNIEHIFSTKA